MEEAGLDIQATQFICQILVSPGGSTEKMDIFIGQVDASAVENGVFGLASEGEDIRVHKLPRETAYQWLLEGKINNTASIIALQWLELNKNNLILI